jgi:hypothetical protein
MEMMSNEMPPTLIRSPDNIEWQFLQTFPYYEETQEPLRKITKRIRGHKKEYYFLETVKSIEELDRTRYTVMLCNNRMFL